LKKEYPEYASLTRGRYFISVILHYLGVNDPKLEKLKKLAGYGK
jgi:hypothetical protein